MHKKIPLKDAVGTVLAHDITEIRPGEFKGAAFKKGHMVCDEDICRLQRLGKNHLYELEIKEGDIHEDQAAVILAEALAGDGIVYDEQPHEGKIKLLAGRDGLLFVDTTALIAFNMVDEVMCATRHTHSLVKKGDQVAATRAIPLVMTRAAIERAAAIARQNGATISVKPLRHLKAGLVITGNEVSTGLIEDRYEVILTQKIHALGSDVIASALAPDNVEIIADVIQDHIKAGCELILTSGGMSVDPDDVTRAGIRKAGSDEIYYGAAALPGAMFLVAYIGNVPVLGMPACGLHHRITVLDLILPRILAGEKIGKMQLAALGHGGLCHDCDTCTYPHCPFGKGV
ncbi:MAG: molybdopterin-binding protein [Desulfobacterales bacterium]|jgi:hypothetical protein|nr:molybdopterin-binding protein [Desulfobacterales bacterium]